MVIMKSIELTEEHKSKLLEMCNTLFTKYKLIYMETGNNDGFANGLIGFSENGKSAFNIHWFEFCMTHLCDKISKLLTNEMCTGMPQYYDESEKLDWNKQSLIGIINLYHPMDYLYEEFKKLKNV